MGGYQATAHKPFKIGGIANIIIFYPSMKITPQGRRILSDQDASTFV
jgi:hypothetical protein